MEFLKKIFGSKMSITARMDQALEDEVARQLNHARTEYLNSMLKVEYHTANARAAEQTIKRLEARHVQAPK